MNSAKYTKEIAPVKLNVHAQWKEAFRLLVLSRKVEMRTENTQLFVWRRGRALRAHNLLKQKRVDCIVVSSKLHVSERSTAPYIVSTS
jgi:hypothetical protein